MVNTLVIDTSYGSTVGIVGYEPIVETDSRTHVERLQVNIASVVEKAGLSAKDINRIVVGVGPAPFTGLRAGIVAAKAIAFANKSSIIGCDSLLPQSKMVHCREFDKALKDGRVLKESICKKCDETSSHHYVLSLNDARRKQVYMSLYNEFGESVIDMDIDYPNNIVERVNKYLESLNNFDYCVDILGHGAKKYFEDWQKISKVGFIADVCALDLGAKGLEIFEDCALDQSQSTLDQSQSALDQSQLNNKIAQKNVDPLYLRRPDVSVPNPLKHVLGSGAANKLCDINQVDKK